MQREPLNYMAGNGTEWRLCYMTAREPGGGVAQSCRQSVMSSQPSADGLQIVHRS